MQIKVDPGTEKWIKWARLKLSQLTGLRKEINLPSMIKFYQPEAGTLVRLKSADWENYITITGGIEYYVLATMPDTVPHRALFLDTLSATYGPPYTFEPQLSAMVANLNAAGNSFINGYNGAAEDSSYSHEGTTVVITGGIAVASFMVVYHSDGNPDSAPFAAGQDSVAGTPTQYGGPSLQVTMSNGEVLTSVPQSGDPLEPQWVTSVWDGTSTAATTTGSISFAVPADTLSSGLVAPEAVSREKLHLQNNSTTALGQLRNGILPQLIAAAWRHTICVSKPDSTKPRIVNPITAVLTGSEVTQFPASGTNPLFESRSVTLSYTDAEGVLHEQIIEGTRRYSSAVDEFTNPTFPTVFEYVNFPNFKVANGSQIEISNIYNIHAYAVDVQGPWPDIPFGSPLGEVVNGSFTVDFSGDSRWSGNAIALASPAYTPTRGFTSSNLVVTPAELWLQYLRDVPAVDVDTLDDPQPAYDGNWLSTSMVDGEVVTLIPFGSVKDDEDLGMYGTRTGAQKVAIYGKAKFRYNLDGSFTFVSWRDGVSATDTTPASAKIVPMTYLDLEGVEQPIDWPSANCAIIYSKFPWEDIKIAAKMQRSAINNPTTQAERFLKLLKSSI